MSYYIKQICQELFYMLTGAILIFIAMELTWPGIVLAYLNINFVLIFWLIIGIVISLLDSSKQTAAHPVHRYNQKARDDRQQKIN